METNLILPSASDVPGIARALRTLGTRLGSYLRQVRATDIATGEAVTPNVPFRIEHALGAVPVALTPSLRSDARVWATSDDRAMWTDKVIYARASSAGKLEVVLYG